MNKELIKKYKTEFDHWLNGGELLYLFHERDLKIYLWSTTYENDFDKGPFDIDYDITDNHIKSIVINDEYVELRKALAEGKTVQYYVDGFAGWQDVDSVGNHGISGKNNYRIKPEEPQFKAGDFVRDIISGKISQVKNEDIVNGVYSQVIKWEPQAGELCWFTDDKVLRYANLRICESTLGTRFIDTLGATWKYCEPFLNSKPSWFKD